MCTIIIIIIILFSPFVYRWRSFGKLDLNKRSKQFTPAVCISVIIVLWLTRDQVATGRSDLIPF